MEVRSEGEADVGGRDDGTRVAGKGWGVFLEARLTRRGSRVGVCRGGRGGTVVSHQHPLLQTL